MGIYIYPAGTTGQSLKRKISHPSKNPWRMGGGKLNAHRNAPSQAAHTTAPSLAAHTNAPSQAAHTNAPSLAAHANAPSQAVPWG
eukprot:3369341-Pyramimonas_sp.AAC.1